LHVLRGEEKDPAAGKDNEEEEDEAPHLRRDDDDGGAQIRFETCALIVKNKLFFFFFFFFFSVFIGSLFFSFFFLRFVPRCCRHFISNPKPKKHPHQNSLFRFRTPALLFGSLLFLHVRVVRVVRVVVRVVVVRRPSRQKKKRKILLQESLSFFPFNSLFKNAPPLFRVSLLCPRPRARDSLVEDERFIFEKKKIRRASTKTQTREREREKFSSSRGGL
jgi:hypothetical protein